MEAFRKKKEVVDTQRRKVTDIIVASVFTKNKWHAHGVYSEYVTIRMFLVVLIIAWGGGYYC